jgi:Tfp pilus assembly protein PilV
MRVLATIAVLALAALLTGCGVRFSDASQSSREVLQSLNVAGSMRAGAPLTAWLKYRQHLPVDVPVRCELRRGSNLVKQIGDTTVPAYAGGSPKLTPVAGAASFDFTVEKPGTYKVECFNPADEDTAIIREFTVR